MNSPGKKIVIRVALDIPATRHASAIFDYYLNPEDQSEVAPGSWIIVPWGKLKRFGLVLAVAYESNLPAERIKTIHSVLEEAPRMPKTWLNLAYFSANYYHRNIGEIALPAIPKLLKSIKKDKISLKKTDPTSTANALAKTKKPSAFSRARKYFSENAIKIDHPIDQAPVLNEEQEQSLAQLRLKQGFCVTLLHGVTGSGKTEIYLRWFSEILEKKRNSQVLLLIPEIALTHQLEEKVRLRFPKEPIALLHSGLSEQARAAHWLAVAEGNARIVIGTRLSVLAPFFCLSAIVVDEEHDASYKQQDGVRYSGRDLAIAKASEHKCPILLGSATPSLESWYAVERNRYGLLTLSKRIGGGQLPAIEFVNTKKENLQSGLANETIREIKHHLSEKKQVLIFINRRGYAPILNCLDCGWLSQCNHCSAYLVYHRHSSKRQEGNELICHLCGKKQAAPQMCPTCSSHKLIPLGQGTQRLEEGLNFLFPDKKIARLDKDVTQVKDSTSSILEATHSGSIDILIGTQMITKGHDFKKLFLVVVLDCDQGLFATNFRSAETLFSTLMQVCGRAGRSGGKSKIIIQTGYPHHSLFQFLSHHDYNGFAHSQLQERKSAGLPPFRYQALLQVHATKKETVMKFLMKAQILAQEILGLSQSSRNLLDHPKKRQSLITVFDPIPMAISKRADKERAQLLIESQSRSALHKFINSWMDVLRPKGTSIDWHIEIDPIFL